MKRGPDGVEIRIDRERLKQDLKNFKKMHPTVEPSVLYLDYGHGFNEQDKVEVTPGIHPNGDIEISYSFGGRIKPKQIRWDPCSSRCLVVIKALQIKTSEDSFSLQVGRLEQNGIEIDTNCLFFDSEDPWIVCPPHSRILEWYCCFEIYTIRTPALIRLIERYRGALDVKLLADEIRNRWEGSHKMVLEALADKSKMREMEGELERQKTDTETIVEENRALGEQLMQIDAASKARSDRVNKVVEAYVGMAKNVLLDQKAGSILQQKNVELEGRIIEMYKTIQRLRLINRVRRMVGLYKD